MRLAEAPQVSIADLSPARIPPNFVVALLFVNLFWAASSINVKFALGGMGPLTLAFARFALAVPFLYLLVRRTRGILDFDRRDIAVLMRMGVLGVAAAYAVFYGGIQWTSATDSTLIVTTEPILIVLLARVMLGERLMPLQSMGMALGFGGVYLIVNHGLLPRFSPAAAGNAAIALALCFEAYASVAGKGLTASHSGLSIVTAEFAIGALTLMPFAIWEIMAGGRGPILVSHLAALAYMAFICTFVCYAVWFRLLERSSVSSMAAFLFIQPVMGLVYGYFFLREHLSLWSAFGAGLVLVGVWMAAGKKNPRI